MIRVLAALLSVLLIAVPGSRAEEVEWRRATVIRISGDEPVQQVEAKSTPWKLEGSVEFGPVIRSSASVVTPQPPASPKTAEEPLAPPRKLPGGFSKPVEPEKKLQFLPPPTCDAPRTVTLLGESPLGAEPPPIDPGQRLYFRGEFLMWFTRLMKSPPLVTTATPPGAALPPTFGLLGDPSTRVLFGGDGIGDPFHLGGRFTLGGWFDCQQCCGLEASYFFLGRNEDVTRITSPDVPIILRPFIQPNPPGGPNFQIVAFPPGFTIGGAAVPDQTGSVTIATSTGLWGAEINARECLCCQGCVFGGYRFDLFAGFRYLDLDDRISIVENIILGANNIAGFPPNTAVVVSDRFSTHSQFYGGQAGVRWEYRNGRFVSDGRMSLALGGTHQTILIDGNQRVTPPGQATQFFTGGLLALPSNIGRFNAGAFSIVPEVTLNVGYMLTPRMRAFLGYNFLYWTRVARAAEQIDPVLDISQIPNFTDPNNPPTPVVPTRPIVPFRQNDFWAQGLQLGLELRW